MQLLREVGQTALLCILKRALTPLQEVNRLDSLIVLYVWQLDAFTYLGEVCVASGSGRAYV